MVQNFRYRCLNKNITEEMFLKHGYHYAIYIEIKIIVL